jgi:catechol 2,3-dioxygenase-like lactoylglutathione lyase family enzyme
MRISEMSLSMRSLKLVVRDLEAAERFYRALGFKVVSRNLGGEAEVRQAQVWLSETGDATACLLILSQFLELPPPPRPVYPGEAWLVFNVSDVEALEDAVRANGGDVLRPGQDRPEHSVRAAVVADPEGHVIEVVGPMKAG